jgi:N-sulfoglucosamine sulfohydrolase
MRNLLVITADDMSYGSLGFQGCTLKDVTPNLDRLAVSGFHFSQAHTTVGLCQPARSVLMTGLYPWKNGSVGFCPIRDDVTTLPEILKRHGYTTGVMGKTHHLSPVVKFPWDDNRIEWIDGPQLKPETHWKNPEAFRDFAEQFINKATRPYFLLLNSSDPHRPFIGKQLYKAHEITVPPFLADGVGTRNDLARYFSSVRRCDTMVGMVLDLIKDDTLVVFTTDHGMAFPLVKANCYPFSSRIPLIYHGSDIVIKNSDLMVSGVDFMPTLLDLLDLPEKDEEYDGKSYADVLRGGSQDREYVYTCLIQSHKGKVRNTRAIHTKKWCYIKNFWSDGTKIFNEDGCHDGYPSYIDLTPERKAHVRYRVPEEFYDLENDYYALHNLINDGTYVDAIDEMKAKLAAHANRYKDKVAMQTMFV